MISGDTILIHVSIIHNQYSGDAIGGAFGVMGCICAMAGVDVVGFATSVFNSLVFQ